MEYNYKFEKFKHLDFPVYSSVQSGKGTIVVPHYHKAAEVNLILNGSCEVYIDSTVITCHKNDVVFIPPYSVHTIIGTSASTKIKGITFNFSLLEKKIDSYSIEAVLNKNRLSKNEKYLIKENFENIIDLISNFSILEQDDSDACRIMIVGKLLVLVSILLKHFDNKTKNENYNRIQPVIEYIQNNYKTTLHISDLSALLNVCDDHFIKLFKKVTNKTPIKYINDLRIEESLKLLVDSDLSVTEISEKVGFSSVNYMIKIFKDTLNTTPKAYKTKKHPKS